MIRSLILLLLVILVATASSAQCPYLNDPFGTTNAPNVAGVEDVIATCIFGGEYETINGMQEGLTYRISTCGDTDFDTELTLFPEGGGTPLAHNDDACELQSIINYTPSVDGAYDIQVNQFPGCQTNQICMTLKIMLLTSCSLECPADITVTTNDPMGAIVNYVVGEEPGTNTCVPVADDPNEESGDLFPVGTTLVGITDATGGTVTCNFNVTVDLVLPVSYLYFRGTPTHNGNLLEWATASEKDNAYFTIQRSIDAWDWEDIKKEEGQGDSTVEAKYQFLDQELPEAERVYYRIKQTDYNGKYSYTDIIALSGNVAKAQMTIYPNPATISFTISLDGLASDNENPVGITLLSVNSQIILEAAVDGNGEYTFQIPEDTPAGLYYLKASTNESNIVRQIIIY